jgi:hypothetical protein
MLGFAHFYFVLFEPILWSLKSQDKIYNHNNKKNGKRTFSERGLVSGSNRSRKENRFWDFSPRYCETALRAADSSALSRSTDPFKQGTSHTSSSSSFSLLSTGGEKGSTAAEEGPFAVGFTTTFAVVVPFW